MKVTSWNVNSLNARMEYVAEWVKVAQPDVLCLQETKLKLDDFPAAEFAELGYESVHNGQGQWNGVAICSRVGLDDPLLGFGESELLYSADEEKQPIAEARLVWATCAGVRIACAYVPNGRELGHSHYDYKLEWLGCLRQHLDREHSADEEVLVLGDFNIAPADNDVWSIKAFEDSTHVSEPERQKLQEVCDWGLTDVLRHRFGNANGIYTYWDYRMGRFQKKEGMRIDLILATAPMLERLSWVVLDRNARKVMKTAEDELKPSDHAPLTAGFEISSASSPLSSSRTHIAG